MAEPKLTFPGTPPSPHDKAETSQIDQGQTAPGSATRPKDAPRPREES